MSAYSTPANWDCPPMGKRLWCPRPFAPRAMVILERARMDGVRRRMRLGGARSYVGHNQEQGRRRRSWKPRATRSGMTLRVRLHGVALSLQREVGPAVGAADLIRLKL